MRIDFINRTKCVFVPINKFIVNFSIVSKKQLKVFCFSNYKYWHLFILALKEIYDREVLNAILKDNETIYEVFFEHYSKKRFEEHIELAKENKWFFNAGVGNVIVFDSSIHSIVFRVYLKKKTKSWDEYVIPEDSKEEILGPFHIPFSIYFFDNDSIIDSFVFRDEDGFVFRIANFSFNDWLNPEKIASIYLEIQKPKDLKQDIQNLYNNWGITPPSDFNDYDFKDIFLGDFFKPSKKGFGVFNVREKMLDILERRLPKNIDLNTELGECKPYSEEENNCTVLKQIEQEAIPIELNTNPQSIKKNEMAIERIDIAQTKAVYNKEKLKYMVILNIVITFFLMFFIVAFIILLLKYRELVDGKLYQKK